MVIEAIAAGIFLCAVGGRIYQHWKVNKARKELKKKCIANNEQKNDDDQDIDEGTSDNHTNVGMKVGEIIIKKADGSTVTITGAEFGQAAEPTENDREHLNYHQLRRESKACSTPKVSTSDFRDAVTNAATGSPIMALGGLVGTVIVDGVVKAGRIFSSNSSTKSENSSPSIFSKIKGFFWTSQPKNEEVSTSMSHEEEDSSRNNRNTKTTSKLSTIDEDGGYISNDDHGNVIGDADDDMDAVNPAST